MEERGRKFRLNTRQRERLFYGSLAVLALFVFLFVGSRKPVLFDDSGAYMRIERFEGVMPIYPFFLFVNQWLFGMDTYLDFVIVEQALFSTACIVFFVKEIKNKFSLCYIEGYFVFLLTLLPFTTEMPQAMMTQTILTEGLAYGAFYLLMLFLLRAVWQKHIGWVAVSYVMVFLLTMLRSQLQILFGVCGIVFLYVMWGKGDTGRKRLAGFLVGIAGCALISLSGIRISARTAEGYYDLIQNNIQVNMFVMKVQDPEYYKDFSVSEDGEDREREEIAAAIQDRQAEKAAGGPSINISQTTSLILSRGMYEADEGDVWLYEDEMLRGLYEVLFEAVDREQQRYAYEKKGLWMWKDIVGGIGRAGKTCIPVGELYYRENYPEIYESGEFNDVWNRSLQTVGVKLLQAHFVRFLYHTLMLLPQAFICTVFFQIAPIYLLCHLVTLFLYLSAVALMFWGYVDKKVAESNAEFMALILGTNLVLVIVISLVFFGQQRYLVYAFGMFYIAYYILLRKLWNIYVRGGVLGIWKKWNAKKKAE